MIKSFVSTFVLAFMLGIGITGCSTSKQTSNIPNDYAFVVKGVSGKNVMLDVTWYKDCVSDGYGGYDKSMRTMSGKELSTTIIKYTSADCKGSASMITVFVQTLKFDNVQVPITWVGADMKPATAPAGLEHVKTGNGATGVVTYATITPLTQNQADALNYIKMGGFTNWVAGETKDMLPYFAAIGPMKGTVVVDDRTMVGAVYDGVSTNPKEYPSFIQNFAPHKGALNGLKF